MHYGNISFIPGWHTNTFVTRLLVTDVGFLLRGSLLVGVLQCVELVVLRCEALVLFSGFISVFVIREKI
jgi:hypothetical protein